MPTHYDVLSVEDDASLEEIRKAFLLLAGQYHPDQNTSPGADIIFLQINEAYEVLSDPSKRRLYDPEEGLLPRSVGELLCQYQAGLDILDQILPSAPMARRRGFNYAFICEIPEIFLYVGQCLDLQIPQEGGLKSETHHLQIPPISEKVPWTLIEKAGPPGANGGSRGRLRIFLVSNETE